MQPTNPFSLAGQTALVTGAGRGIGFALASALAAFDVTDAAQVNAGIAATEANVAQTLYVDGGRVAVV
jgi:NAD(P)-dependent dehydrogenase (short-subunit alcohol dehydrogenase family)